MTAAVDTVSTVVVDDMVTKVVVEVDTAEAPVADTVGHSTEVVAAADRAIRTHKPEERVGTQSLAGLAVAQPQSWGPVDAL